MEKRNSTTPYITMFFDDLCEVFYWVAIVILSAVMAVLGWLFPWIAPTAILFVIGLAVVVSTYSTTDVLQGIFMFVLCPLLGTYFYKPALDLGSYEWLLGAWTTAFILGCITAYVFQHKGKRSDVTHQTPAIH